MGGAWNNQRRETGGTLKWVEPKVGGARSLRVAEEVRAAGCRPPDGGGACVLFPSAHRAAGVSRALFTSPGELLHASGSLRSGGVTFSQPRRRS